MSAGDPRERTVAIVSLGRGILWAHMSIVMYNIHVGEYGGTSQSSFMTRGTTPRRFDFSENAGK